MRRPVSRLLVRIVLPACLGVLLLAFSLSFLASWPRPRQLPAPAPAAWQAEPFAVQTLDGLTIAGEIIPGRRSDAVVLLAHGIGHNRRQMDVCAERLRERGYPLYLFDLRGHGESEGQIQTLGIREGWDVAAVQHLAGQRHPGAAVIAWGFSLGAAALLHAAAQGVDFRAIVVHGSFARVEDTIDAHARLWLGLPAWLSPLFRLTALCFRWRVGGDWSLHDPADAARQIRCPVLLVAGSADNKAPPVAAVTIFRQLPRGSHEILIVPGLSHRLDPSPGGSGDRILRFIDAYD